jgi:glycine/D-amino acid oxidase-like deaminating enzyme
VSAADIGVVGGGLVGSALAYGLAKRGAAVALFYEDEDDLHASAGNFGLVWVQGKGLGAPEYEALTRRSATAWAHLADELVEQTGLCAEYRRSGGLKIALSDTELRGHQDAIHRLHNQRVASDTDPEVIDAAQLRELVPEIGPEAVGATWCVADGHADPLTTLRALRRAAEVTGQCRYLHQRVQRVRPRRGGFDIETDAGKHAVGRVVIAAGLGSPDLAAPLGLDVPLRPQRGQILVTERMAPFLDIACHNVRQTGAGTVLIGDSKEDVGFDRGTLQGVGGGLARRAVRIFPRLADARIVRHWGALRVMSPDGLPVYAVSRRHPGAMLATCHSGVTLAAAHAGEVAEAVLDGGLAETYAAFSPDRFARAPA